MSPLEFEPPVKLRTCPLCCHAFGPLTEEALAAGGGYQCDTCGQRWTALRLGTVAAYRDWVAARTGSVATH